MKAIFISCVLLLINFSASAQQDLLKFVENTYLSRSQLLTTASEVNKIRDQINMSSDSELEFYDNAGYYKTSYNPSVNVSVPGLVFIGYSNQLPPSADFDKEAKGLYDIVLVDNDPSLAIKETIKGSDKNATYVFIKGTGSIKFLCRSVPKGDRVLGYIEITGLTDAQMKAFAKDFIQKMKFK